MTGPVSVECAVAEETGQLEGNNGMLQGVCLPCWICPWTVIVCNERNSSNTSTEGVFAHSSRTLPGQP